MRSPKPSPAVAEAHSQTTSPGASATGRITVSKLLEITRVPGHLPRGTDYCCNYWCLTGDSNPENPDPESGAFANFASEALSSGGW